MPRNQENIWFTLRVYRVNGLWRNFDWYLFLLLSVGTQGNTSCAISVALASCCIEAKNFSVLIFLTHHWNDRDRKRTQENTVCDWLANGLHKRKQGRCNFRYFIILQFSLNLIVASHFQSQYFLSEKLQKQGLFFFISMRVTYFSVDLYQRAGGITWGQLEALPFNKQWANGTRYCLVCWGNTTCYSDFHKRADAFVKKVCIPAGERNWDDMKNSG